MNNDHEQKYKKLALAKQSKFVKLIEERGGSLLNSNPTISESGARTYDFNMKDKTGLSVTFHDHELVCAHTFIKKEIFTDVDAVQLSGNHKKLIKHALQPSYLNSQINLDQQGSKSELQPASKKDYMLPLSPIDPYINDKTMALYYSIKMAVPKAKKKESPSDHLSEVISQSPVNIWKGAAR